MRTGAWAIAVALLALGGGLAPADRLSGHARLVDGDTIEVAGRSVRLHGIDAPETGQHCLDDAGHGYACGAQATETLRSLVGDQPVTCTGSDRDRYGRLIAICHAGETDLNAEMVRLGMAVAYERYSDDYLLQQAEAIEEGRGLWAGTFETPSRIRAARWRSAEIDAPEGCPIKGNISRNGRIYHPPWSQWYERTRIDTARGERWLCSEDEARRAGWRPAYR